MEKNEVKRMELYYLLLMHQTNCDNKECVCKIIKFKSSTTNEIKVQNVLIFIESMFNYLLKSDLIRAN